LATTNSKFLVKNGLAVAGSTGTIDVINTSGQWIGATGILSGATGAAGVQGATGLTGSTGPLQYITYGNIDMGTFLSPANISIDLGTF
jgi:hypothetical protein